MGNLTQALVFVMAVNVLLFLGQMAILDVNPDATTFFTNEDTLLSNFNANKSGTPVLDTESTIDDLPTGEGATTVTTDNFFTDTFSSIKSWIGRTTGLAYIFGIISAPYNMLKIAGLPPSFVFAVGTFWYAITFILVIAFIWGRDA